MNESAVKITTKYYYVTLEIQNQYFQPLPFFGEIKRRFKTHYQALNTGFMIILK